MAMVSSRKWVTLEHGAAHGWSNQCTIGTVSDNAYSSRILWSHPLWGICLFVHPLQRAGLFSSYLFAPMKTAALHPTQSWAPHPSSQHRLKIPSWMFYTGPWSKAWFVQHSMCPHSSPYSICLGILELSMHAICPSHPRCWDCRMGYSDWMPALLSTTVSGILSCHLFFKIFLKLSQMKTIQPPLLTSIQGPHLTPVKECWEDASLVNQSPSFTLSASFSHALFTSLFNAAVAFPILLMNSSSKDRVDLMLDPKLTNLSTVFRDSPPSFISGGEFVPCPITSVFLALIVSPKRLHDYASWSASFWILISVCC